MKRRVTIEIDDELLVRARRALGNQTYRATVEEALRRLANEAEDGRARRAARQPTYLQGLRRYVDVGVLAGKDMWR